MLHVVRKIYKQGPQRLTRICHTQDNESNLNGVLAYMYGTMVDVLFEQVLCLTILLPVDAPTCGDSRKSLQRAKCPATTNHRADSAACSAHYAVLHETTCYNSNATHD